MTRDEIAKLTAGPETDALVDQAMGRGLRWHATVA